MEMQPNGPTGRRVLELYIEIDDTAPLSIGSPALNFRSDVVGNKLHLFAEKTLNELAERISELSGLPRQNDLYEIFFVYRSNRKKGINESVFSPLYSLEHSQRDLLEHVYSRNIPSTFSSVHPKENEKLQDQRKNLETYLKTVLSTYFDFLQEKKKPVLLAEYEYTYQGELGKVDALIKTEETIVIYDLKSGKAVESEHYLQMLKYAQGIFETLSPVEQSKLIRIETCLDFPGLGLQFKTVYDNPRTSLSPANVKEIRKSNTPTVNEPEKKEKKVLLENFEAKVLEDLYLALLLSRELERQISLLDEKIETIENSYYTGTYEIDLAKETYLKHLVLDEDVIFLQFFAKGDSKWVLLDPAGKELEIKPYDQSAILPALYASRPERFRSLDSKNMVQILGATLAHLKIEPVSRQEHFEIMTAFILRVDKEIRRFNHSANKHRAKQLDELKQLKKIRKANQEKYDRVQEVMENLQEASLVPQACMNPKSLEYLKEQVRTHKLPLSLALSSWIQKKDKLEDKSIEDRKEELFNAIFKNYSDKQNKKKIHELSSIKGDLLALRMIDFLKAEDNLHLLLKQLQGNQFFRKLARETFELAKEAELPVVPE